MRAIRALAIWVAGIHMAAAQSLEPPGAEAAARPAVESGLVRGYLMSAAMPNAALVLELPPAPGSAAWARDEERMRQALALQGSARWSLAASDAELSFPAIAAAFSCALNASMSEQRTPRLARLLLRMAADAGRSTLEVKRRHQRPRPFLLNGKPTCTPHSEEVLRTNGSYPSGHAAIGLAIALVLSELAPERTEALVARGRQFGQSRVVCNVHWSSDVAEGQVLGAAVVARLHAEPEFRADLEAARAELGAIRGESSAPTADCTREAQVLTAPN